MTKVLLALILLGVVIAGAVLVGSDTSATPPTAATSSSSMTMSLIWLVAIVAFATMLYLGAREHLKAPESPGPKLLVSILGVLAVVFLAVYYLFGSAAIERGFKDLRILGDEFAERSTSSSASGTGARDKLCGPGKYTEKTLTSTTVPVRLDRVFPCVDRLMVTTGIAVRVRYNGHGPWKYWGPYENTPPVADETVRYMEILLVKKGEKALVTLRHGW